VVEPRIIKKYPNRRLYDTAVSRYITLEDVRRLVLEGVEFCVREARTGEDITRSILLQVILEQEEASEPVLSTALLKQLIRFYGDTLQGMMTSYLERSMEVFIEQQAQLREQMRASTPADPFSIMREATEQNLRLWRDMHERFLRAAGVMGNERAATRPAKDDEGRES